MVAAAVILDPDCIPDGIDDSKALTAAKRAALCEAILGCARVGIGVASVEEIDRLNILWATMLAMTRAVAALSSPRSTARRRLDRPAQLPPAGPRAAAGRALASINRAARPQLRRMLP